MNHETNIEKIKKFLFYMNSSRDQNDVNELINTPIYKDLVKIMNIEFLFKNNKYDTQVFKKKYDLNDDKIIEILKNGKYEKVLDKITLNSYAMYFCKLISDLKYKKYFDYFLIFTYFRN